MLVCWLMGSVGFMLKICDGGGVDVVDRLMDDCRFKVVIGMFRRLMFIMGMVCLLVMRVG